MCVCVSHAHTHTHTHTHTHQTLCCSITTNNLNTSIPLHTQSTPTYYKWYPFFISSEQNSALIYIVSYAFYIPRPYYPFLNFIGIQAVNKKIYSSVNIVTPLRTRQSRNFPKFCSSPKHPARLRRPHRVLSNGRWGFFYQRWQRFTYKYYWEKNEWSYASTPHTPSWRAQGKNLLCLQAVNSWW